MNSVQSQKEHIVNFLIFLQNKGLRESTVIGYSKTLRHLAKHVNLDDPQQVKRFIANKQVKDSRKDKIATDYDAYVKWRGLTWQKPIYKRDSTLPFIPLEKEIDQLISASTYKTATFLQLLKESACRPIEAWRIKWTQIDFERNLIYINDPAKHSNPRVFKASARLMNMIRNLPRKSDYVFRSCNNSKLENFARNFYFLRRKTAEKLGNPRILKISFKTFRHWKATTEYHKTKDILHVMKLLGHKNIKNTLVYTHLVNFESDEYTVKVAKTLEDACKLVEAGFEYVCEMEDAKIFRKRK